MEQVAITIDNESNRSDEVVLKIEKEESEEERKVTPFTDTGYLLNFCSKDGSQTIIEEIICDSFKESRRRKKAFIRKFHYRRNLKFMFK